MSIHHDDLTKYNTYPISTDLKLVRYERKIEVMGEEPWKLLFSPRKWALDHPNLTLDDYRLSADELKEYALQISRHRA